jgi:hypothetical protein
MNLNQPNRPLEHRAMAADRTASYVPPGPAAATAAYPDRPAAVVARDEPDAETRSLLRRRRLVIFSILTGAVGLGNLAILVTGVSTRLDTRKEA